MAWTMVSCRAIDNAAVTGASKLRDANRENSIGLEGMQLDQPSR